MTDTTERDRLIEALNPSIDASLVADALLPMIREMQAEAVEGMARFFRLASQLGTGERDEIAAQACDDRAAKIRAGE